MLAGLYSAATGINVAERNQEVIARNLANVNRAGYRRSVLSFQTFENAMGALGASGVERGGSTVASEAIDFSPGAIERTGRSLDVALDGDGFLVLDGPQGPLLTRGGVMYVGDGGTLIASNGMEVLGDSGPITIPPEVNPEQLTISPEGDIISGQNPIAKLRLQTVADKSKLTQVGEAMFRADPSALTTADGVVVHQGSRERSNVAATSELVRMIVGMRHHEASQRALRSIEDSLAQHTQDRGV